MRSHQPEGLNSGRARACVGVALGLLLAGCGEAFTTGAASMRIEVEVYKGPLSKDPHSQWGELLGLVREADVALQSLGGAVAIRAFELKAIDLSESDETAFLSTISSLDPLNPPAPNIAVKYSKACVKETEWYQEFLFESGSSWKDRCVDLLGLFNSYILLRTRLKALERDMCYVPNAPLDQRFPIGCAYDPLRNDREVVELLTEAAEISSRANFKSFYWAANELGDDDGEATRALVDSVNLFSNIANQVSSRADRLLLQIAGTDRKYLPLSVYLREVEPTDFTNLYDWFDARADDSSAVDDTRVIERLFDDFNWANINTVYASGQGDVAMAFIKDDIGNWNLKAFENDPTELLQAYTNFTLDAIAQAAKLVQAGASGGGTVALDQALSIASQAAAGQIGGGSNGASLNVMALHDRAALALLALRNEVAAEFKRLKDSKTKAEGEEGAANTKAKLAQSDAKTADTDVSSSLAAVADPTGPALETAIREVQTAAFQAEFTIEKSGVAESGKSGAKEALATAMKRLETARSKLSQSEVPPPSGASDAEKAAHETNAVNLRKQASLVMVAARLWVESAETQLALAETKQKVTKAKEVLAAYPAAVAAKVRDVLDDHAAVLSAVEEMVVAEQPKTAPKLPVPDLPGS